MADVKIPNPGESLQRRQDAKHSLQWAELTGKAEKQKKVKKPPGDYDVFSGPTWRRFNPPDKVKEEVEMYTIEDLVASAVAQKPGDFEEAFNSIMLDRVGAAVEDRKLYLAQTMFNPVEEEVEEVEEGKKNKRG